MMWLLSHAVDVHLCSRINFGPGINFMLMWYFYLPGLCPSLFYIFSRVRLGSICCEWKFPVILMQRLGCFHYNYQRHDVPAELTLSKLVFITRFGHIHKEPYQPLLWLDDAWAERTSSDPIHNKTWLMFVHPVWTINSPCGLGRIFRLYWFMAMSVTFLYNVLWN